MKPDHVAVQAPIGKPVVWRQQSSSVFLTNASLEAGFDPSMKGSSEADGRVLGKDEGKCDELVSDKKGERHPCTWNGNVTKIV